MSESIVLDILPVGAPFSLSQNADYQLRKRGVRPIRGGYLTLPMIFALTKERMFLFVGVISPEKQLEAGSNVDLNDKDTLTAWARISYQDLSSSAKAELEVAVESIIKGNDKQFVTFFNKASPISTRLHSLELIPGIVKKHIWEIIEARRKPFESLAELKERLPFVPDPQRGIKNRILKELEEDVKYSLFVLPRRRP